jgi:hypothetical protein
VQLSNATNDIGAPLASIATDAQRFAIYVPEPRALGASLAAPVALAAVAVARR